MPNIPTFTSQVSPSLGPVAEASPSAAGAAGAALARAGGAISDEMAAFNARYQEARREADTADKMSTATQGLGDAQFNAQRIPNKNQALANYDARIGAQRSALLDPISDPLQKSLLTREFDSQAAMRRIDVGNNSFQLEANSERANLEDRKLKAENAYASATSPAVQADIANKFHMDIAGAVHQTWITPVEGQSMGREFDSNNAAAGVYKELASGRLDRNPSQLMALAAELGDVTNPKWSGLTPEDRAKLENHVITRADMISRQIATAIGHQDAIAERVWRQTSDDTEANLELMIHQGQNIPEETLVALVHGRQLTREGEQRLLGLESGRKDDPATVYKLNELAANQTLTADDIRAAQDGHLVSPATSAKFWDINRKQGEGASSTIAKSYYNQLVGALGGKGAGAGNPIFQEAQGIWTTDVEQKHMDPRLVFDRLMGHYAPNNVPTWIPELKGGGRPKSYDEVQQRVQQWVDALNNHKVSQAEFDDEAKKLRDYATWFKNKPDFKPPPIRRQPAPPPRVTTPNPATPAAPSGGTNP